MAENGVRSWSRFFQRNKVMIIMVPMIIGVHLGWGLLQNNERFVPKSDRENLPLLKGIEAVEAKIEEIEKKMLGTKSASE